MNKRLFIVAAEWLIGLVVYIGLSYAVCRAFVFLMQCWAHRIGADWGEILLIRLDGMPALLIFCFLWGALYASALSKPACFGGAPRILKHLAWSYFLSLLSLVFPIRIELLNFPDFKSTWATPTLIFAGFGISICCFVLGLAVWVHLAFGGAHSVEGETSKSAELQS